MGLRFYNHLTAFYELDLIITKVFVNELFVIILKVDEKNANDDANKEETSNNNKRNKKYIWAYCISKRKRTNIWRIWVNTVLQDLPPVVEGAKHK